MREPMSEIHEEACARICEATQSNIYRLTFGLRALAEQNLTFGYDYADLKRGRQTHLDLLRGFSWPTFPLADSLTRFSCHYCGVVMMNDEQGIESLYAAKLTNAEGEISFVGSCREHAPGFYYSLLERHPSHANFERHLKESLEVISDLRKLIEG